MITMFYIIVYFLQHVNRFMEKLQKIQKPKQKSAGTLFFQDSNALLILI